MNCICHNKSFEEIISLSKKEGISSIQELQDRNVCATKCKLCVPYLIEILEKK